MKYLVPYDFTPVTRSALDHAIRLSEHDPGEIEVLHIIGDENDRQRAEDLLRQLSEELETNNQIKLLTRIRLGNIFTDIAREAEEAHAQLLVMGTHGAKGLQKVLGSKAIKVITSSRTPFIVTQTKPPKGDIRHIIMPVNLQTESTQVATFASELARKFKADIHIVHRFESDEFLNNNLRNNVARVRKLLARENISYRVVELQGKQAFHKEVVDYGEKADADMIAVAHFPQSLIPQFDKFTQELITNRLEIPVLVINAREVATVRSNYSYISI